jgi:hypothetical protein
MAQTTWWAGQLWTAALWASPCAIAPQCVSVAEFEPGIWLHRAVQTADAAAWLTTTASIITATVAERTRLAAAWRK